MGIFFDKDGIFQWASVAALISFVAAVIAAYSTRKSIDANLKAKARIDWIDDVRKHTSILITEYYNLKIAGYEAIEKKDYLLNSKAINKCFNELNLLCLYFQNNDIKKEEKVIDINKEIEPYTFYKDANDQEENRKKIDEETQKRNNAREINQTYLTKLYDCKNNDGKHIYMVVFLKSLKKSIGQVTLVEDEKNSKYMCTPQWSHANKVIDGYIDELSTIIGIYLKIEWDKAKKGK